jgi:hypothetical protein
MLPRDTGTPAKRRTEYRPPAFLVDALDLEFDLAPEATAVTARLAFRRNPHAAENDRAAPLTLDGEDQADVRIELDGVALPPDRLRTMAGGVAVLDPAAGGHADGPLACRPGAQRVARGPVPLVRRVLHAVRGRGLPPHHVFPRPARRAGALHGHPARRACEATRCCCPTATWSPRARSPTGATSPRGTTRSRSRRTCSRWSRATCARRSKTRTRRCRGRASR